MSTLTNTKPAPSLADLAVLLKIPRFRPEGMIFRRTDARLVKYIERTEYGEREAERWEYEVRHLPLQQTISVYDPATKTSQMVEIKVEDRSSPIFDAGGVIIGYNPLTYAIQEDGKGMHFHANQFVVRDELVYYYLMLCEYNGANTVDNKRRRPSSPVPTHFELFNPKRELENKREAEKLRNKAIAEIGKLNEPQLIALSMRYGSTVNYPDGTFMSDEDMAYVLQSMIGDHNDLSKGINSKVMAEKIVRDTGKKQMEGALKVAACVRNGILQFNSADNAWHYCTHNGKNYIRNRVLCQRSAAHSDSYDAIIDHLAVNEADMALLSAVPPLAGHDRMEFDDPFDGPPVSTEPPADGKPLSEMQKGTAIRQILAENALYPHHKLGHQKLLEFAKTNNVTIPAHLL